MTIEIERRPRTITELISPSIGRRRFEWPIPGIEVIKYSFQEMQRSPINATLYLLAGSDAQNWKCQTSRTAKRSATEPFSANPVESSRAIRLIDQDDAKDGQTRKIMEVAVGTVKKGVHDPVGNG